MTWSPQQNEAINAVRKWLDDKKGKQVFRLFGYAGTGKTTIAKSIAGMAKGAVLFACFTGKASLVLRSKGCDGASTIHSLIYRRKDPNSPKPEFVLNPDSQLCSAALLIVDEVSMVGDELACDLLSFGVKVLVLGDPAQLPPVKGTGYFIDEQPDFMLTEIHRQAADNPIIRMSMEVREGRKLQLGSYGDSRVIQRQQLGQKMVMAADQVLVGMNRTRRGANAKMRVLLGRASHLPEQGDRLVCLRNDKEKQLLNGGLWEVSTAASPNSRKIVKLQATSQDDPAITWPVKLEIPEQFFLGTEDSLNHWARRESDEFDYGYALTTHKAQGSQWANVLVMDESNVFKEDARKWIYTAITRAAERVTVVQ